MKKNRFAHLAVEVSAEGKSKEWREAVADARYNKLN